MRIQVNPPFCLLCQLSLRAASRPPSLVINVLENEKIMTRPPSIRVKPGSLQGLERKAVWLGGNPYLRYPATEYSGDGHQEKPS